MINLQAKYQAFFENIQKKQEIKIHDIKILDRVFEELSEEDAQEYLEDCVDRLDDRGVKDIIPSKLYLKEYRTITGYILHWGATHHDPYLPVRGWIRLWPLKDTVKHNEYWNLASLDMYKPEKHTFLKRTFMFDGFSEGIVQHGVFYIPENHPNDTEFPIYYYLRGLCLPMNVNIMGYLEALIDSCSIQYWQFFYIDIVHFQTLTKEELKDTIKKMEEVIQAMEYFFPENDRSYHIAQLEKIKAI
jgi:hypothetical protein